MHCSVRVYEVTSSRGSYLIKRLIPAGFLHYATIGDDAKLDVGLGWEVRITGVGPGKVNFASAPPIPLPISRPCEWAFSTLLSPPNMK